MRNKVTDVGFKVKYLFVYFNNLFKLLFSFTIVPSPMKVLSLQTVCELVLTNLIYSLILYCAYL